jgi:hypothetical protein
MMHLIINRLFTILVLGTFISSCKTTELPVAPTVSPSGNSLYLVGTMRIATNKFVPAYWKDGKVTQLSETSGAAVSLTTDGNDIYVVGFLTSPANNQIVVWKNGTLTSVTAGDTQALINDIAVDQNHAVYIVGGESVNGNGLFAKYWENGVATVLSNTSSNANRIVISGSDIYIAGYANNYSATYWKNGVATIFSSSSISEINDITIVGKDVHAVGYEGGNAKYWKNGVSIPISISGISSHASGIAVVSGNVFVGGCEQKNNNLFNSATYWKNETQENILTDGGNSVNINSIGVIDQDVYLAGNGGSSSFLWKNGIMIAPFNGTNSDFNIVKVCITN